jgi:N6-L-threonylcarbamoyladenine synthase
MNVLGIESSCDETGVALVSTHGAAVPTLRAHALHSQVQMHEAYGGVVPELASRDHIRRVLPLAREVLASAGADLKHIDVVAYTRGPGLAGALLVGAGVACALAAALDRPTLGVHHLEGHLLSPFLSADPPAFPFVALLVSGGHTQLLRVDGIGRYTLLGDTVDDAAGEAFDKSAKLLGLGYPGGPALSALATTASAEQVAARRFPLPRPKLRSDDLDFSFSGLKTAVLTHVNRGIADADRAAIAHEAEEAITDVLAGKALRALEATGLERLVVCGGVSANGVLRRKLAPAPGRRTRAYFPELSLCGDNGAMIAFAAAMRLEAGLAEVTIPATAFDVKPRWPL